MKRFFIFCLSFVVLSSCSLSMNEDKKCETSKEIATRHYEFLFTKDALMTGRAVDSDIFPEYFYDLKLESPSGECIAFKELDEEEKMKFVDFWKENEIRELSLKLESDKDLQEMVKIEDDVFQEALEEQQGRFGKIKSDELFSLYENKMRKRFNKNLMYRGVNESNYVDKQICLESLRILKDNYKKGRILVCKDTDSSSGSSFIGHSAMMSEEYWNPEWEK